MRVGIIWLVIAYGFSQFYRVFLAVLAPDLQTDIGAGAEDLASASALWFQTFAVMQIPVGWALDRFGPRRLAALLMGFGAGGGAVVFALASQPVHLSLAMALIGVGCSPVLMASYYIFARAYPPKVFATMGALVIAFGSLGNLVGATPMAWAVEAMGWRNSMLGLAVVTALVAIMLWVFVKDPPPAETDQKGSLLELLRMPALWPILAMMFVNYVPAATIRGLWAGPYLEQTFGAGAVQIGQAALVMGIAMILGNFAYGPLDRIFGTRKWVVFVGNLIGALACLGMASGVVSGFWGVTLIFALIGFCGSSFPVIVAHGRAMFPPHLTGRGVTLLNLFGIGGVGVFQALTGPIYQAGGGADANGFVGLFLFFGALQLAGLAVYLFSRDRTD